MGYVDDLFKMYDNTFFIQENGALNIQATIIKAIVIGGVFFIVRYFSKIKDKYSKRDCKDF